MIPSQRPAFKELRGQLQKAKGFVAASSWAPAIEIKLMDDLHRLGLYTAREQADAFMTALSEIDPAHYVGRRPPEKAYEKRVYGREMFAFCWSSRRFLRTMYFKFCVTKDALFILSFHESKARGPRWNA